jgi:hypothetical protein
MTKKLVLLAAIALLLPCAAMANTVSFTTVNSFFTSSGTNSSTAFPSLKFTGLTYTNLNAPSGGITTELGTFSFAGCKKCSGTDHFKLQIDQTSPKIGSKDIDLTLTGTFTKTQQSLFVTFTAATVSVGTVTYSIPFFHSITVVPGSTTTLNGNVANATAPEPDARLLLGLGTLGLMGLALVSRKAISI